MTESQRQTRLAKKTEMLQYNIILDDTTDMWEAWDESSSFVVAASPYWAVALQGHMWYCENILSKDG